MTTRKIAFITGANKGIGFETARQLGQQQMIVVIGARDPKKGETAAQKLRDGGIDAHAVAIGVTNQTSIRAVADQRAAVRPSGYPR